MGYNCNDNIDVKTQLFMETDKYSLQLFDNEFIKLEELKCHFFKSSLDTYTIQNTFLPWRSIGRGCPALQYVLLR